MPGNESVKEAKHGYEDNLLLASSKVLDAIKDELASIGIQPTNEVLRKVVRLIDYSIPDTFI